MTSSLSVGAAELAVGITPIRVIGRKHTRRITRPMAPNGVKLMKQLTHDVHP